jgi:formamidopyrimidine-DNA glycosylase
VYFTVFLHFFNKLRRITAMPELPEVETVRQQLIRKVVGKTIDQVEVFHDKTVAYDETIDDRLSGHTITDIDRIGKLMIFRFKQDEDLYLLAHLKMTGQFFFEDKRGNLDGGGHSITEADMRDLPNKHTRVAFYFTDATALFFNDMRLFGYTKLTDTKGVALARAAFGPEPIADDFDYSWFAEKLRKRNTPVKAALLDQSFIAGLGNIYVDEALWRAKIRPTRKAKRVTKKEALELCKASGDVMKESIAVGGTTFQHFVDTGGKNGNFTDYLKVFGKQDSQCERCGDIIKKIRCAGRGTHYCPSCQK